MSGFRFQFHADPNEVIEFVLDVLERFRVRATAFAFGSEKSVLLTRENTRPILLDPEVWRVFFTTYKPHKALANQSLFIDMHPQSLVLDIARVNENKLGQRHLSTLASETATIRFWRQILNQLKKQTRSGVYIIGVNDDCPTSGNRFTLGAKQLEVCGVEMTQGGTVRFRFAEWTTDSDAARKKTRDAAKERN